MTAPLDIEEERITPVRILGTINCSSNRKQQKEEYISRWFVEVKASDRFEASIRCIAGGMNESLLSTKYVLFYFLSFFFFSFLFMFLPSLGTKTTYFITLCRSALRTIFVIYLDRIEGKKI